MEEQHIQAEERGNKLKQLLVKTKKDLADAKKLVSLLDENDKKDHADAKKSGCFVQAVCLLSGIASQLTMFQSLQEPQFH